jgi:hypothetical protein
VLLEDIVDVRYAIGVAERIEDALREPFPIDGHEATVTASIGIAVSSGRESTPDDLMRNSDQAMYQAKRRGRARHVLFALAAVTEEESDQEREETAGSAAGRRARWPGVEEQLAVEEELAAEAAIEGAMVIEHAEAAPLDDGADEEAEATVAPPDEGPAQEETPAQPDTPAEEPAAPDTTQPDESLGSAAALTEARRRRRLRFPPRG